ncbi:MAG: SDR family NAD(P)-dependent oxidoreductase [Sphingomonadaceae bacterium]|nr:SDR family NAD(P)-dependent oxidoreductase [Sphingomonadaceae bacterium]
MPDFPLPHASHDLTGEVALVTGATSGLGWRFARVLASVGAKVAIAGRRQERLDELAALIRGDGGEIAAIRADMSDAESIVGLVEQAETALGTVTILVNNAGIVDAERATKMPLQLIDDVFDTNLRGPYILSCEVARRLVAAKKPGRMVNIASIAAYNYSPGSAAALYSITKAGMVRLTEVLAVEWSRFDINVNGIAPGLVRSEMSEGMLGRMGDFTQHFPRKKIIETEQLDSTLLYLCAPSSDCVTGTVIKLDDGQGSR